MDGDGHRYEHDPLSEVVIGRAFVVANTLGSGFLEKVYENALAHELRKAKLEVEQQSRIKVRYDEIEVGEYIADLIVAKTLVVELKACKSLDDIHVDPCGPMPELSQDHWPTNLLIDELRHSQDPGTAARIMISHRCPSPSIGGFHVWSQP